MKAALSDFERAARLDPKNTDIQFNLGIALLSLGRPERAVRPLSKAASDPKLSAEARYLLGASYFQLLEREKVVEILKDLPEGPHTDHVLYMVEESNRLLGRSAEAREAFRQLNRRFPDSAWTHYLLAIAHESQQDLDKAIQEYKTALARDPKLPNAPFAIGYVYWRQQNAEEAKAWLEKQVAVQPCHALALYYLGQIARVEQDQAAAARDYKRAVACDAGSADAHIRLGMTLEEMNQNADALREFKRAVELAPENAAAHYRLALMYRKLGRSKDSESEYEAVRRLKGNGNAAADQRP